MSQSNISDLTLEAQQKSHWPAVSRPVKPYCGSSSIRRYAMAPTTMQSQNRRGHRYQCLQSERSLRRRTQDAVEASPLCGSLIARRASVAPPGQVFGSQQICLCDQAMAAVLVASLCNTARHRKTCDTLGCGSHLRLSASDIRQSLKQ